MDAGYDWGTTKAAKRSLEITPGQDQKSSPTNKEVKKNKPTSRT